jgi:endonuclease/exonuclease/phosphatase family metal-dependent hydrolase
MESPAARRRRRRRQIEVLSDWENSPRDIICLQEVNPLVRHTRKLSAGLAMRGEGCVVNAGVKIARVGLPPFLEEGLAIFSGSELVNGRYSEITLSGVARELRGPFGLSAVWQLQERRKAFVFESECQGEKVAVVNLHLHHGPDTIAENLARKKSEIKKLCDWLRPRLQDWDLLAVCGDFNCDANSACVEPLLALGLKDSAMLAGVVQEPTWNPELNPIGVRAAFVDSRAGAFGSLRGRHRNRLVKGFCGKLVTVAEGVDLQRLWRFVRIPCRRDRHALDSQEMRVVRDHSESRKWVKIEVLAAHGFGENPVLLKCVAGLAGFGDCREKLA